VSEEHRASLMPVSEALDHLRRGLQPVSKEHVALADTVGRVLAESVVSDTALPPFANSAMDGYAVRARSVDQASEVNPVVLDVIGDLAAAANPTQKVGEGEAMRILTGAPLPEGSDAVVPVEYTSKP
jgi:molybdopterin biosynthesis enzyme